jgi:hypothetical protein
VALPLDPERIVQKDLEIQEYTDPEHDPLIPQTLVLKLGLVVHSAHRTCVESGKCQRSPGMRAGTSKSLPSQGTRFKGSSRIVCKAPRPCSR